MNAYAIFKRNIFNGHEQDDPELLAIALNVESAIKAVRTHAEAYVKERESRNLKIEGEGLELHINNSWNIYFYAEEAPLIQ